MIRERERGLFPQGDPRFMFASHAGARLKDPRATNQRLPHGYCTETFTLLETEMTLAPLVVVPVTVKV